MSKVYECGFTSSGTTQSDTVGGVDITLDGSAVYQTPLSGFSTRPGWFIDTPSTVPHDNNEVLYFRDTSRPQKTIILWFRITSGDGNGDLMSGGSTYSRDGLYGQGGRLRFVWNGTTVMSTLFGVSEYSNNEWHMAVVQSDYINSEMHFYADGNYVNTYSAYLPDNNTMLLGSPNCEIGLLQVYDHLLTSGEISDLWNTGLIDALVQQPVATINGTVYGFDSTPISGAVVALFNHSKNDIDSTYNTTSGGAYNLYVPTVGEYSIYTSVPGRTGGRAVPMTVTSGGITYHVN